MRATKNKPRPKQKLSRIQEKRVMKIVWALVVVALLWIFFYPGSGLVTLFRKQAELAKLQRETSEVEKQTSLLQKKIDRVKNNPAYLEKVARKDFGLLKKNEKVFDFSKEQPKENE